MNRDEIIELARNAIEEEDSHAFENAIFKIADEYLSNENKELEVWTER